MTHSIRRILVAIRDLHRPPRTELRKAAELARAANASVSRSTLRRIFIGSTAERVLDELRCDVLIVKPRGFESAVATRTSTGGGRQAA
jgi:Universal stress protein family